MVIAEDAGRVRALELPPHAFDRGETWIIAVWTPMFTEFLHRYVMAHPAPDGEISVGTPEVWARAVAQYSPQSR